MKLSIVLTVYNKAPYLNRAFDCLLNQKDVVAEEYEILVVNDGSTDESLSIIENFARKHENVRILNQDNQGLSMARNNGTLVAKGEYVWYIDADDIITTDAIRQICNAMDNTPDIISIYAKTQGEPKTRNEIPANSKKGVDILLSRKWEPCGVFNILRRKFLVDNHLYFLRGIYHEDCEFTPRMLFMAKTVKVVPSVLYIVIHESNSITQVPRVRRAFDYLKVAVSLDQFISHQEKVESPVFQCFNDFISIIINNGFDIIVKNSKDNQLRFNNEFKLSLQLLRPLRAATLRKYRIEAFLFNVFPNRYVEIYKTLKFLSR